MDKTQEIAKVIREALEKRQDLGELTPLMLDPNNLQPTLGLMVETDEGTRLEYTVNIINLRKENLK